MSAFIVHPEHINVLLWAGLQHVGHSGPLRWAFANPTEIQELHPANASHVGQMLLEENIASVNHLYNESRDVSADYTPTDTRCSPVGRYPSCSTRCTATSTRPASILAGPAAKPTRSVMRYNSG